MIFGILYIISGIERNLTVATYTGGSLGCAQPLVAHDVACGVLYGTVSPGLWTATP